MLKLNNTIKVMVPTADNDGKAIDYMKLVQGVTKLVGGSTMYDAQGLWLSRDTMYKDSNKLVEFNTTGNVVEVNAILRLVYKLIVHGGQLAVWLQVNGTTYIIDKGDNLKEVFDTIENESMVK